MEQTLIWQIVLWGLCLCAAVQVSSDTAQTTNSLSLDSALTQGFNSITLETNGGNVFTITKPLDIATPVSVWGQGQTVRIAATVSIQITGKLSFQNVTVTCGSELLTRAFDVQGSCIFEDVLIEKFEFPVFWVSGGLMMWNTAFVNNSAPALSVQTGGEVICRHLSVLQNASPLLVTQRNTMSFRLQVSQSHFSHNGPDAPLFDISSRGQVSFSECEFEWNSGALLYTDSSGLVVSWNDCLYHNNTGSFLSGYLSKAQVTCSNTTFADNSEALVALPSFEGSFLLQNSLLIRHKSPALFSVVGSGVCQAEFQAFAISDINVQIAKPLSGAFEFFSCLGRFDGLSLVNVTLLGQSASDLRSLVYVALGDLQLFNFSARIVASSGYFLVVSVGSLILENFYFERVSAGSFMYSMVADGAAKVLHGQIVQPETIRGISSSLAVDDISIFIFIKCVIEVTNVTFGPASQPVGVVIANFYSSFHLNNLRIFGMKLLTAFGSIEGNGSFSNALYSDIVLGLSMLNSAWSSLSFANFTVRNVSFTKPRYGLFAFSSYCNASFTDISVFNVTAEAFLRAKVSAVTLRTVSIEQSSLNLLLHYILNSHVELSYLTIKQSKMQLIQLVGSTATFADSIIAHLQVPGMLFGGLNSELTLRNVTLTDTSLTTFCRFQEGGALHIENSYFRGISSSEGCKVRESRLEITTSSFHSFDFALFQAVFSNVTLRSSKFHNGESNPLSLVSADAYGGVVGCVDCLSFQVTDCTVLNVSAYFGGALAARRAHKNDLLLWIANSTFEGCSAIKAGAILTQNVSFVIENSRFLSNRATSEGGALHVALKPDQSGTVLHSLFLCNSAHQGGGVQWTNAEVFFTGVNFTANRAEYGADIASYGVQLSSSLTHLKEQEVSGVPLQLVFEFQDHYGHRVTVSPPKFLELLSTSVVTYRGNQVTPLNAGLFNYSEVTVYAPPSSAQTITAAFTDSAEDFTLQIQGSVSVAFRDCIAGEIRRADRCEVCYSGNFSFSPNDSDCHFCPAHALCPGGSVLQLDKGYWRNDSVVLQKCPFPAACMGGVSGTCAGAWTGLLCTQCAPQAYRIRVLQCTDCSPFTLLQFAGALLAALLFMVAVLRLTASSQSLLYAFKVGIHHLQLLSTLNYLRLEYSPILNYALHGTMYVSAWLVPDLPLSCLDLDAVWGKTVVGSALLPAFGLASLLLGYFASLSRNQVLVLLTSSLLFIPHIVLQVTMPLLTCWTMQSENRLLLHPEVQCWEGTHLRLVYALVLPTLLLYVVAPFLLVLVCGCVKPQYFRCFFPLWTCGYAWILWDLFFSLAKFLLVYVSITTINLAPLVQVTAVLAVLIVVSCVNVAVANAFTSPQLFAKAQASLLVTALSTGFVSYYLFYEPGEGKLEWLPVSAVLLLNFSFSILLFTGLRKPPRVRFESAVELRAPCNSFASPHSRSGKRSISLS